MADRTIRKSGPLPYYAQLASILREQIEAGTYVPGDLLPSEAELGTRYGISRTAVRQALDELVSKGIVHKEKGRGTFVSRPGVATFVVQELRGFSEEMSARGDEVETDVLAATTTQVPPFAVTDLQLSAGDEVLHLERVRRVNGQPVVAVRTWLPVDRFPGLLEHDFEHESLYELLTTRYGVRPGGGRRRFEALAASEEIAGWLGLEVGDPVLTLTAVNFDDDDLPFEFFIAWYRADQVAFEVLFEPSGARPDAVLDLKQKSGGHRRRRRDEKKAAT